MRALYINYINDYSIGDSLKYDGEEFHHLKNVIRVKENDGLAIIDGKGVVAGAVCLEVTKKYLVIKVTSKTFFEPKNRECAISQIKRESLEVAIRSSVEMGVSHIHIVKTDFSQNFKVNINRIEKIIISAMIQSNNPYLCKVTVHKCVEDFLEKHRENLLVLDNLNESAQTQDLLLNKGKVVFVGPEGGFSARERSLYKQNNISSMFFDAPILRAETAIIAALSLNYLKN